MGKRIRVQRRGRGGSTFKASTHKRMAPAQYLLLATKDYLETSIKGVIEEFVHDPGRGAPLAFVSFENGKKCYTIVPEGVSEGQQIQMGGKAGDGGKIAKGSGAYSTVVAHTPQGSMVKLPSGKTRYLNDYCRATIGVVSGAGRLEKPLLKAGAKFHLMKAKGHKYPRTRGRAMIAAVHPYGSSKKSARKGTTVSRHAPPGQKVGLIAAKGAGQKKRR